MKTRRNTYRLDYYINTNLKQDIINNYTYLQEHPRTTQTFETRTMKENGKIAFMPKVVMI